MKDFSASSVCFRLASAPVTFQQVMSKILKDCRGVQFYPEDIIVYNKSQQQDDENLRQVLSAISHAGMKFNHKGAFNV